jgi:hypothetical protein
LRPHIGSRVAKRRSGEAFEQLGSVEAPASTAVDVSPPAACHHGTNPATVAADDLVEEQGTGATATTDSRT